MSLPADAVSLAHPTQMIHDFEFLSSHGKYAKLVFRVYDLSSISPLVWTGLKDTSGFFAPNGNLSRLSATAYRQVHADKRGTIDWTLGHYTRQTIVDHTLQKWRSTALNAIGNPSVEPGKDIPEDDKSPWISTTRSLTWSIWEIARRLTIAHSPPEDLVPDKPNGISIITSRAPHLPDYTVRLTIIRHHSGTIGLYDARRGFLEAHIDPKGPIGRIDRRDLSLNLQKQFDIARKEVVRSEEVLYYGRIFAESIDSNLGWTAEETPFELPAYFYKPPEETTSSRYSEPSDALPGWLDDLVWDPRVDDYDTASRKIGWRRRQVEGGVVGRRIGETRWARR